MKTTADSSALKPPDTGLRTPGAVVDEFLRLIMIPDPVAARRFVAPGMRILFTGGRAMADPTECTAFNASRYKWVKKRIERTETVAHDQDAAEVVVYSLGTLYGEWPDGTPFVIKVGQLRGVESFGMLCSARELVAQFFQQTLGGIQQLIARAGAILRE